SPSVRPAPKLLQMVQSETSITVPPTIPPADPPPPFFETVQSNTRPPLPTAIPVPVLLSQLQCATTHESVIKIPATTWLASPLEKALEPSTEPPMMSQ